MRASGDWFSSPATGSTSRGGAGGGGPGRSAAGDEHARLVGPMPMPEPPPPAMGWTPTPAGVSAAYVPAPVPVQPRPWSGSRSSVPWVRLVVGLLLLVLLGYAFIKWGLPFLSEKVMLRSPIKGVGPIY